MQKTIPIKLLNKGFSTTPLYNLEPITQADHVLNTIISFNPISLWSILEFLKMKNIIINETTIRRILRDLEIQTKIKTRKLDNLTLYENT